MAKAGRATMACLVGIGLTGFACLAAARAAGGFDVFTFAAAGDMIGPYTSLEETNDPALEAVSSLFRHADLGFANQEGSIFDLKSFRGYPAAENGGGYPVSPAAVAKDIRDMGITVVSKANNHATDWGTEGLVATLQALSAAGVAQAGSGMDDKEARSPAYVRTARGRAALVAAASTFPPMSVAGPALDRRGTMSRGRPGISALHVREVRLITGEQMTALRLIAGSAGYVQGDGELRIGDQFFRVSAAAGATTVPDKADEAAILASIREARRNASFVVFAIHAHQTAGRDDDLAPAEFEPMVLHRANEAPSPDDPRPAAFEVELFHRAIDAGADAVVRTGPHAAGGIEIYRGKPIFYGLGSLFFDFQGRRTYTTPNGQVMRFPDEWFETFVPVTSYRGGAMSEIRLYPVAIESSAGVTGGHPHLAEAGEARRILERLTKRSAAFGTAVTIEHGVGIIRQGRRGARF